MTKQRLVTSFLIVVGVVFVLVIVQNPSQTTLDVLLWTITLRQGLSLVLAFGCGVLAGWVGHLVYRRLHSVQPPGRQDSGSVPPSDALQSIHTTR